MYGVLCSGEKPHVCSVCGKTFSQSGSRNVHMKKRHGHETLPPDGDTGNTLIILLHTFTSASLLTSCVLLSFLLALFFKECVCDPGAQNQS